MINIQAVMKDGYLKIEIQGHANYDVHGKDIVCCAVSTVVQTALLGLQAIADEYPDHVKVKLNEPKVETEGR